MAAYTGTPALPALLAGDIPSSAEWGVMLAALHGLTDPWVAYTPIWTATTTNPVLGNGTSTGKYAQVGKTVLYVGSITTGSTTTYGSGSYLLSTPTSIAATVTTIGFIRLANATTSQVAYMGGAGAATLAPLASGGNVNPTTPFTWTTNNNMSWSIMYEAT